MVILSVMDLISQFLVACPVHDDIRWVREMILGVHQNVSSVLFLLGKNPWYGEPGEFIKIRKDLTALAHQYSNIEIIEGDWESEGEVRNFALKVASSRGIPYVAFVDTDEIYDPEQFSNLQKIVASNPLIGCFEVEMNTYWKTPQYIIDPPEVFAPPVFVRTQMALCKERRHFIAPRRIRIPRTHGVMHHFSYVRSDEEVKRKIETFSHRDEVVPGWYENIWLNWNESMENIHPCWPEAYKKAIFQDLSKLPEQVSRSLFS